MMNCMSSAYMPEQDDERTRLTLSADSDSLASVEEKGERNHVHNTDYKKVTPLFRAIETENWEGVLRFLTTGRWSDSMFTSNISHLHSPSPEIQAKTWVTAYDRQGTAEWSQLPLHAAISYLAPLVVVQKLVQRYPKAIQCTENEGMLPIHLAFGFGSPDPILAFLLEPFPASMNVKGLGNRLPHECCELGPNKIRGRIYSITTSQAKEQARADMDHEWRTLISETAHNNLGLVEPMDVANKSLNDVLTMLLEDRKELERIRRKSPKHMVSLGFKASGFMKQRSPGSKMRLGRKSSA